MTDLFDEVTGKARPLPASDPEPIPGSAIETVKREVLDLKINKDFAVATAGDAQAANDALGKIKTLQKRLDAAKMEETRPLNEQLRDIRAKYDAPQELLWDAERILKAALVSFKKAEQKQLEQQAAERQALAEKERQRLLGQADRLRAKGRESEAHAAEQTAQLVAAPVRSEAPTKLAGSSFSEVWAAQVVDPRAFLKALAESDYDIDEVVSFKVSGLKKLAGMLKGNMEKRLPGSIAWPETGIAARAK